MTCELHGLRYPNLSPDLRNSQPLLLWIRFQPPWKISFPSATLIPDSQIGSFDGMLQTTSSPLTLFNPFSFVLFWLGSFKIPVFCLTDSFFCLIHFAVGIFYCIFNFIHCILQYWKFYLVLFNDFYLFVKLPVSFFMLLSWFHFFFLCYLLCHWVSWKQLFQILSPANLTSPCIWDQLLEDYCNPSSVSSFPGFSCSLKFSTAVFVLQ